MKVQVINLLGAEHDADIERITEVCQTYATMVCADHEMAQAIVVFVAGATEPSHDCVAMIVAEDADTSGALGYHDTDKRGLPYGKAFLGMVPDRVMLHDLTGHGASLAGVITHELAELLGDRFANVWANGTIKDPKHGTRKFGLISYELCDPCQDNAFTLKSTDGSLVDCSDYVLPNFFNGKTLASVKTTHMGSILGPMKCAPGGYLIVAQESGETQVFGRKLGGTHDRVVHEDVAPPAWREAIRALKYSRSSRRASHHGVEAE